MKPSTRLLALLLSLVLAFSLALPAFAEDDLPEEPNPAMPIITVQPVGLRVKADTEFTLSVEAYIPNGDEVGYEWRHVLPDGSTKYPGSRNSARISQTLSGVRTHYYTVVVYNRSNPEYRVTSETVSVKVYQTPLDVISNYFMIALGITFMGGPLNFLGPLLLLASPIVLPFQLINYLIQSIFF